MPNADTATFPAPHVTSLQGSEREYFEYMNIILQIDQITPTLVFEIRGLLPCVVVVVSSAVVATVGP